MVNLIVSISCFFQAKDILGLTTSSIAYFLSKLRVIKQVGNRLNQTLKAALDRRRKKEIGQDQQDTRQQEDSETQSSVDQP